MFIFRVSVAVVAALAAATLLLTGKDVLVPADMQAGATTVAGIAAAMTGLIGSLDSAIQAHRAKRRVEIQALAGKRLLATLYEVSDAIGIDRDALGIALYIRTWTGGLRRVEGTPRLLSPAHSGIRWRVGKGAIGWAVKTGAEVCVDLTELDREFELVGPDGWRDISAEQRLGLSPREMRLARGKYAVVLASPVFGGRKGVSGCVALDVSNATKAQVYVDPVRRAVSSAATAVSGMIDS